MFVRILTIYFYTV